MLTISSINVNGIRAAYRRGMAQWITDRDPHIMLMQEVRASDEVVHAHLGEQWHTVHQAGAAKGRNGVAVASRLPIITARIGLLGTDADGPEDQVGRWVEAEIDLPGGEQLTAVSTYVHAGTADTPSMDLKYAFLDAISDRLAQLLGSGRDVVVAGDFNIAHTEADLKNWKGNLKNSGFLPAERAYLDRWGEQGWVDLGRWLAGDGPGPYTWWSWRGKAFDNDAGWRIDYQFASPSLAAKAKDAEVDRAPAYDRRFSDHAPLSVRFDA